MLAPKLAVTPMQGAGADAVGRAVVSYATSAVA